VLEEKQLRKGIERGRVLGWGGVLDPAPEQDTVDIRPSIVLSTQGREY
jgi:hypothetical protein